MEKTDARTTTHAHGFVRAGVLGMLLAVLGTEATAATIVPPANLGELGRRSGAVVLATALGSEPVQRGALLFTRTRFHVQERVSGPAPTGIEIHVDAPGGEANGVGWAVAGSPRFEPGTTYLLFLSPGAEGRWQTTVLSWGICRRVSVEGLGNVLVPVEESEQLSALPRPDGTAAEVPGPLLERPLVEHLGEVLSGRATWDGAALAAPRALLPGGTGFTALAVPPGCAFMSDGSSNIRWQTFDSSGSVSMSAALPGDASLSGGGFTQVQGALSAWDGVPSSSMSLAYGGSVSYTLTCTGGQDAPSSGNNVVVFNDPCSDIADLSGCSGTLAFGGPWYGPSHTFDGVTWRTITSWFVVVNNGAGCLGASNYQIMMTHELGHGLGFNHVSDSSAMMYFMCCNNINSTDRTCAQYVYPSSAPPTPPVANFTFSPSSPVILQTVSFTDTSTNSPTSWAWTFGDGGTSTAQNPTHAYASAGTFNVTLTATNAGGSDPETKQVTVSTPPAPVASFTFSPGSPLVGQTVFFTDTSTNTPTSWSWNFGDPGSGGANTSTQQNPSHVFASGGSYTVTLTASNSGGSNPTTRTVVVSLPPPPTSDFSFSPPSPVVGQNVQFFDASTGSPTSWAWDFGDGNSAAIQNPAHAYATSGTFTVTLVASNAGGSSGPKTRNVTVVQPSPPVASFSYSPGSPVAGQAISFFDQSTGGPTSWLWTFGDGASSTASNPVKTYGAAGTYTVTLRVTNAFGTNTTSQQLAVGTAGSGPTASFGFSPAAPTPGQTVQFTDASTGGPTSWSWNFGDPGAGAGNVSSLQNPGHVYGLAGTWTATLTVSNAFGSSTTSRQIVVAAATNRDPVAVADSYTVAVGSVLTVNPPGVLSNDSDPDGDALTASLVSTPAHGTIGLQPSGAFVYTPSPGYVGSDAFTYRVVDARGAASSPATVAITVSSAEAERVVPIVLDAFGVGSSRFRSELVLANRGSSTATVEMTYTAATALNGSGSGTVSETLGAGRQLVLDDALAYLRSRGLLIPQAVPGASQGGTLRLRFRNLSSASAGAAFARTTALLAEGRAGVAYPALAPADWQSVGSLHVFGLRETSQARSNLALVNLGSSGDVGLRVTVYSGTNGDRRTEVLPETVWLGPLQWTQLGSVLSRVSMTNGWILVERVSGSAPFYAYGVFNDYGTNDGSFIDPVPVSAAVPSRTVPVILELGIYSTELILTNPTSSQVAVGLSYVESLSAPGVARKKGTDLLAPREQKIVEAIPHLRALGVDVGAAGGSYGGSVVASFSLSGQSVVGFAGARTKSPGQPEGSYGVYYSGLGAGQMSTSEAWVYGLKQDGESRTNVAIAHAEPGGAAIGLQAEVFDGTTGASVGKTGITTLAPGQWFQWNQILSGFGVRQGYVRVTRVSGTSRFLAYGVVNDGGSGRPGTNDGSYVQMLTAP